MRESLTRTFQSAMEAAQRAARSLNQDFVGTEHAALGLLQGNPSIESTGSGAGGSAAEAVRALQAAHADVARAASALRSLLPAGDQPPLVSGQLPLSPRLQRVVSESIVGAQAAHEPRVSTRFLLLALLAEPQNLLQRVLCELGTDIDVLRQKLAEKPPTPEA